MMFHLNQALAQLCAAYSLSYPEKVASASADFIVPALILVLLRTKLKDSFALIRYLKHFCHMANGGDLDEVCRTNFVICNEFILRLESD